MLSCPATYCNVKGPCTLPLGQKGMTQSVQASIGMSLDLFSYLAYLFFQHLRPERLCRILRAREDVVALGVVQKPFEYFPHLVINHQLALSRSPFQTALDYELSADFHLCTLLRVEANAQFRPSDCLPISRNPRFCREYGRSGAPVVRRMGLGLSPVLRPRLGSNQKTSFRANCMLNGSPGPIPGAPL